MDINEKMKENDEFVQKVKNLFSKRLRKLIYKKSNLENESKKIGINSQTLRNYILYNKEASIGNLALIAKYYKISTDYLLGFTKYKSRKPSIKNAAKVTGLDEKTIIKLNEELDYFENHKQFRPFHKILNLNNLIELQKKFDYFSDKNKNNEDYFDEENEREKFNDELRIEKSKVKENFDKFIEELLEDYED